MDETINVISTKLSLVDPNTTLDFSAYQQSAEIRQLWKSVESSIQAILTTITKRSKSEINSLLSNSSHIITVLSASTLLSSIIHAIIITQKRINKSDDQIEAVIKKEIQVILFHIQIFKQDLNQTTKKGRKEGEAITSSTEEAIMHHLHILVDSLLAYTLSPINAPFQVHPYKVNPSPSISYASSASRSYQNTSVQPIASTSSTLSLKKFTSSNNSKKRFLPQYGSNHSLNSTSSIISTSSISSEIGSSKGENTTKTKTATDTVGKKFMRSIHSLKSRPGFHMALIPNRHSVEPISSAEEPPKKKRISYQSSRSSLVGEKDELFIYEEVEENISMNAVTTNNNSNSNNNHSNNNNKSLRFKLLNNNINNGKSASTAKTHSAKGIKELFQHPSITAIDDLLPPPKKNRRESISQLFNYGNNSPQKKKGSVVDTIPNSTYYTSSTSTSSSSFSSLSADIAAATILNNTVKQNSMPYLISPYSKNTNIRWSTIIQDDNETDMAEMVEQTRQLNTEDELKRAEKSRKRRSNGSLVVLSSPTMVSPIRTFRQMGSPTMNRTTLPLPPLPTVENFLNIMCNDDTHNTPTPTISDTSFVSARSSASSNSNMDIDISLSSSSGGSRCDSNTERNSNQSSSTTINSMLLSPLDKVIDRLASTQITEGPNNPPPVPPKDSRTESQKDNTQSPSTAKVTSIMNNRQEKKSNSFKRRSTDMRITTTDIPHFHNAPKSAAAAITSAITSKKNRPPIPPRRSSMPTSNDFLNNEEDEAPPLPIDAKEKTIAYRGNRKSSNGSDVADESSWSTLLSRAKRDGKDRFTSDKRVKLGRSLGAEISKKSKKSSNHDAKVLQLTENGKTVLLCEMMSGKLQTVAGTVEKLFEKLADETTQDMEYVDTFVLNHSHFISSSDLLDSLISRFHLGPSPGEYEYFKKWQHSIQSKVLNVLDRWIILQYVQDFKSDQDLQKRLNLFLFNNDIVLLQQFKHQVEQIQLNLKHQISQISSNVHYHHQFTTVPFKVSSVSQSSFNFHFPIVNNSLHPVNNDNNQAYNTRRPSNGLFNLSALSTPPDSPTVTPLGHRQFSLLSFESRDIARYLTLSDYYLFKSIQTSNELYHKETRNPIKYVDLMTKRSNMISHWAIHEVSSVTAFKEKRALLKKFIEVAKLCLDLNNFHTCMIISMGITSTQTRFKEAFESLSNRDQATLASLLKLINIDKNMKYYRQKLATAKSPCIPFLPVVLKDQTFFNENSNKSQTHCDLVNFSKYRSICQFINQTKLQTKEQYWFAQDLSCFPFFPNYQPRSDEKMNGQLDQAAEYLESRISSLKHCYLSCSLLSK